MLVLQEVFRVPTRRSSNPLTPTSTIIQAFCHYHSFDIGFKAIIATQFGSDLLD